MLFSDDSCASPASDDPSGFNFMTDILKLAGTTTSATAVPRRAVPLHEILDDVPAAPVAEEFLQDTSNGAMSHVGGGGLASSVLGAPGAPQRFAADFIKFSLHDSVASDQGLAPTPSPVEHSFGSGSSHRVVARRVSGREHPTTSSAHVVASNTMTSGHHEGHHAAGNSCSVHGTATISSHLTTSSTQHAAAGSSQSLLLHPHHNNESGRHQHAVPQSSMLHKTDSMLTTHSARDHNQGHGDERGISSTTLKTVQQAFEAACREYALQRPISVLNSQMQQANNSPQAAQFQPSSNMSFGGPPVVAYEDAAAAILEELMSIPPNRLALHCVELHLILLRIFEVSRSSKHVMLQAMRSMASLSPQVVGPVQTTNHVQKELDADGSKMINGYVILDELGRGSCAKVKLAFDTQNSRMVAIKIVRRVDTSVRAGGQTVAQAHFQALQREIAVMKKLRHKNIVSLYEVIDDPEAEKLYLVMQYIDDGPIASIKENVTCTTIPPLQLLKYARNIFAGLMYLHAHNIIHRDIKLENILVSKERVAYLADFGVSEVFGLAQQAVPHSADSSGHHQKKMGNTSVSGVKGTVLYMAPELLQHGQTANGRAVDIWACGVTLFAALTGRLPFKSTADILAAKHHLEIPTEFGPDWQHFLKGLLSWRPEDRLTAVQAHAEIKDMIRNVEQETRRRMTLAALGDEICIEDDDIDTAFTAVARAHGDNSMLIEGRFSRAQLLGQAEGEDGSVDGGSSHSSSGFPAVAPSPPTAGYNSMASFCRAPQPSGLSGSRAPTRPASQHDLAGNALVDPIEMLFRSGPLTDTHSHRQPRRSVSDSESSSTPLSSPQLRNAAGGIVSGSGSSSGVFSSTPSSLAVQLMSGSSRRRLDDTSTTPHLKKLSLSGNSSTGHPSRSLAASQHDGTIAALAGTGTGTGSGSSTVLPPVASPVTQVLEQKVAPLAVATHLEEPTISILITAKTASTSDDATLSQSDATAKLVKASTSSFHSSGNRSPVGSSPSPSQQVHNGPAVFSTIPKAEEPCGEAPADDSMCVKKLSVDGLVLEKVRSGSSNPSMEESSNVSGGNGRATLHLPISPAGARGFSPAGATESGSGMSYSQGVANTLDLTVSNPSQTLARPLPPPPDLADTVDDAVGGVSLMGDGVGVEHPQTLTHPSSNDGSTHNSSTALSDIAPTQRQQHPSHASVFISPHPPQKGVGCEDGAFGDAGVGSAALRQGAFSPVPTHGGGGLSSTEATMDDHMVMTSTPLVSVQPSKRESTASSSQTPSESAGTLNRRRSSIRVREKLSSILQTRSPESASLISSATGNALVTLGSDHDASRVE